jgi:hypothetical protein
MESEEELVGWFLDNFQDDQIVAFVLVFFRSSRSLAVAVPIQAAALGRDLTVRMQFFSKLRDTSVLTKILRGDRVILPLLDGC